MSKAAWPSGSALKDFLAGAGIVASPPAGDATYLDYDNAAAAAVEEFERRTGYSPFMAASTDVTRYYTPDGTNILDLRGGVAAALTSVTVGYSPTTAGTALTVNEDYYLMPLNAITEGRPATHIQFWSAPACWPRSIVVVGKFGYCANQTIPDLAYQTVLYLAGVSLMPQVQTMLSQGGLKRMTEGDVTYEWQPDTLAEVWGRRARAGIGAYKRLNVL